MSFTPKDSPFSFSPEQQERLAKAEHPNDIRNLIESFLVENGSARVNEDGVNELVIGPAASARSWEQTVELNGEKHTVSGTSELDLARNVTAFYKEHGSQTPTPKRGADGKFVAEPTAAKIPEDDQELQAAVAELRLKVVRGDILPDEFVSQKAEMESGLANTRQWQQATELFRNSSDWVGGDRNKALLIGMIEHLDLMEGDEVDTVEKKAAILSALWQKMRDTGNYFEAEVDPKAMAEKLADAAIQDQRNEEYASEIANAKSASEVQEINTRYGHRPTSSSLFDR